MCRKLQSIGEKIFHSRDNQCVRADGGIGGPSSPAVGHCVRKINGIKQKYGDRNIQACPRKYSFLVITGRALPAACIPASLSSERTCREYFLWLCYLIAAPIA